MHDAENERCCREIVQKSKKEVLVLNPNLLQITTIPIKIEIKVTNATYEYPDDRQPKVNI